MHLECTEYARVCRAYRLAQKTKKYPCRSQIILGKGVTLPKFAAYRMDSVWISGGGHGGPIRVLPLSHGGTLGIFRVGCYFELGFSVYLHCVGFV